MLPLRSVLVWVVVLTISMTGWGLLALTVWQLRQSEKDRALTKDRLDDQLALHDVAQRRLRARNAGLSHRLAKLEREIDELIGAHGDLASLLERQVGASRQIARIESEKQAAEIAVATLVLQTEALKSTRVAMDVQPRRSKQVAAMDARRLPGSSANSVPASHSIRKGLYAFAELKVSEARSGGKGEMPVAGLAVHAKPEDEWAAHAAAQSIKAAFKRSNATPASLNETDWAETQFELGKALAAKGRQSSGTRELKEAVLAFRAAAGEWRRDDAPLKWAKVQLELERTLALLSRRSGG